MNKNYLIIGGVIAVLVLFIWSSYNSLVRKNLNVENQWAQVETQYQRRFDLIPNLVSSVEGVMKQEKDVFNAIAQARSQYAGARTTGEKVSAANNIETSLGRLLMITENYPQLKSSDNVQTLMSQLEGSENRVSVERSRFNDAVRDYNMVVRTFPGNIVAGMFGFNEREFFKSESGSENAPKVKIE